MRFSQSRKNGKWFQHQGETSKIFKNNLNKANNYYTKRFKTVTSIALYYLKASFLEH